MPSTRKTGFWFSLTCRDTINEGDYLGVRCRLLRWHVGAHDGVDPTSRKIISWGWFGWVADDV